MTLEFKLKVCLVPLFFFPVFSGASPVGLILAAIVAVAYKVAIRFEG